MSLQWIQEQTPVWDATKAALIGRLPAGAIVLQPPAAGALLPGEWWRVEADGDVVAYGWMDHTWGDAEILLAVDPARQGQGIGSFVLDQLEREAAQRGLNYLYNVLRDTHPARDAVQHWLQARGFVASGEDGRLLRRRTARER